MNINTEASKTTDSVVNEITRLQKSLPKRPEIEEVEAARAIVRNVDSEDQVRVETIENQTRGREVSLELFSVYLETQKESLYFRSKEEKKKADAVLELENVHLEFDKLIQKAFQCVNPDGDSAQSTTVAGEVMSSIGIGIGDVGTGSSTGSSSLSKPQMFSKDDSHVTKFKAVSLLVPEIQAAISPAEEEDDDEEIDMLKFLSSFEVSSRNGSEEMGLSGKLSDLVASLPDRTVKLSNLTSLDLSESQIVTVHPDIGRFSSLLRLDLHNNRITVLPETIWRLLNLEFLDLRGNILETIPPGIGSLIRLEVLDLRATRLSLLPLSIGTLVRLRVLNLETNNLEELPHPIGQCTSLEELRVGYNELKALPESVGRIASLQVLSVRYNNIRQLPPMMFELVNLRELDVSFNHLEGIPASFCFATSLVRLDVSNNFAALQALPNSIGNLELLEYLDISNNQIRVLPDSFRFLSNLTTLRADQNPWQVPPRQTVERGPQAVVEFMTDFVESKGARALSIIRKKKWISCLLPSSSSQ